MNKYQEALNTFKNIDKTFNKQELLAILTLQELINKQAKTLPTLVDDGVGFGDLELCCPMCLTTLYNTPNYCPHCGQAIDWRGNK